MIRSLENAYVVNPILNHGFGKKVVACLNVAQCSCIWMEGLGNTMEACITIADQVSNLISLKYMHASSPLDQSARVSVFISDFKHMSALELLCELCKTSIFCYNY